MIMENFAERLFCDLKNAGIKIDPALYTVDGNKIGEHKDMHQFNIFGMDGKYCFGEGFVWSTEEIEFKLSFTEAYNGFLANVMGLGKKLKFYSLVIPRKGVIDVKQLEYETVVGRYIKDYLPQSDTVLDRWDFMVGKA